MNMVLYGLLLMKYLNSSSFSTSKASKLESLEEEVQDLMGIYPNIKFDLQRRFTVKYRRFTVKYRTW